MCVKTISVLLGSNTVGSPGTAKGVRLKRNGLTTDYFPSSDEDNIGKVTIIDFNQPFDE